MNILSRKNKQCIHPYLLFLPFLILYIILIILFSKNEYIGDETRYLMFAENLLNGHYSPAAPYIDLGNSPGYPIILTPLVEFNIPLIYVKVLNGFFYYFSLIFLFKSLRLLVSNKLSFLLSMVWALYPIFFEQMIFVIPEVFVASLVPFFIYFLLKAFSIGTIQKSLKYIIVSGALFGYMALTKPIFGYVILCLLLGSVILYAIKRKNISHKKGFYILAISLLINLPYLIYTYNITGKIFYWSSFGGNNLYWMSTPFEREYGDWMGFPIVEENKYLVPGSKYQITQNHQRDFEKLLENKEVKEANIQNGIIEYNLTKGIAQDELLKELALQNIKNNPVKFIKNCISNVGRMVFNYPYSYSFQKPGTLYRLPINGTLLLASAFCFFITLLNWRQILYPIRFLVFMILIYFGGSIFGSADSRMFFVLVPVLLIWIAYIIPPSIKVNWKWRSEVLL